MTDALRTRLEGRRVLITGAASGIGRATVELFARHGAALALVDRAGAALDDIAARLGYPAFACDVADEAQVETTVAAAEQAMGGLDGVINAAGICPRGAIEDMPTAAWRETIEVNLIGPYLVSRAAAPTLRRSGQATIVNIASIGALRPARGVAAYCASKAGLVMLSKCLAVELAPQVRVNAVCPGTIETPMTQDLLDDPAVSKRLTESNVLQRLGTPDEIAQALLHLTSHESAYVNGATLVVDGGFAWH